MLTKTQLKTAQTPELVRLKSHIDDELEKRRKQEEERCRQEKIAVKERRLFFSAQDGHYQWEYRQCGHKERCRRCKSGKKHGPYLYRYIYSGGKQRSQYIKLSDLAKHPEAPPRPPTPPV
jgi:hypothetical protein